MRFLSIEYQVEMCSPAERAHACGLWNLKSPYCYCLTCFRFCHTRVLFFSSVSYYFYDLICYHFLLKLCIAREFCLCSIFSWHNEWISFGMSFEESKIDSHGNQQQIRFHAKGRWTQKSQMKKYGFYPSSLYVGSVNTLNRKAYLQRPFVVHEYESKFDWIDVPKDYEIFICFSAAVGVVPIIPR